MKSDAGVPFLKDIPWLGRAFSNESEGVKKSELVVLVSAAYSSPVDAYAYAGGKERQ